MTGPRCPSTKPLRGQSYGSMARGAKYSAARHLRSMLLPSMTQREVAARIGMTRQAVEQTELRALAKLLAAFEQERIERA